MQWSDWFSQDPLHTHYRASSTARFDLKSLTLYMGESSFLYSGEQVIPPCCDLEQVKDNHSFRYRQVQLRVALRITHKERDKLGKFYLEKEEEDRYLHNKCEWGELKPQTTYNSKLIDYTMSKRLGGPTPTGDAHTRTASTQARKPTGACTQACACAHTHWARAIQSFPLSDTQSPDVHFLVAQECVSNIIRCFRRGSREEH